MKLLLTSIDDVEMRRLKEGFYNIMKLSNVVKDKGPEAKQDMIEFSQNNKLEKPETEAVLFFKAEIAEEEVKKAPKGKKKKAAPSMMRRKPMLKIGGGDDASDEEKPATLVEPEKPVVVSSDQSLPGPEDKGFEVKQEKIEAINDEPETEA